MKQFFNSKPHELKQVLKGYCGICICFCLFFISFSCNNISKSLTFNQSTEIKDSVEEMVKLIAEDISHDGPIAWLRYFENSPQFFMASEGQLVFSNNDSATTFIKNILIKQIRKIDLDWSNIRIDPFTSNFASIAATWHEEITDFTDKKISQGGYFTAIAEKTIHGWKLRNAHWSVLKSK